MGKYLFLICFQFAILGADDTDPNNFFPLGRKTWKVASGICQLEDGRYKNEGRRGIILRPPLTQNMQDINYNHFLIKASYSERN